MARACLLVMMQPAADLDAEFNDWYDTDHVPERLAVPGFLSAHRYECLDGWPRYLALYDLDDIAVLSSHEYLRVAEGNYTSWTRRVLKQVRVFRHALTPHAPEDSVTTTASRLLAIRFSRVEEGALGDIWHCLTALRDQFEDVAQVRLMTEPSAGAGFALVELRSPLPPQTLSASMFRASADRIDLWNSYVARRIP